MRNKLRIRGVPKRLILTWKLQPSQLEMSCELSYQHTHTSFHDATEPLSRALGLPTQTETSVRPRQQNPQNRKTQKFGNRRMKTNAWFPVRQHLLLLKNTSPIRVVLSPLFYPGRRGCDIMSLLRPPPTTILLDPN